MLDTTLSALPTLTYLPLYQCDQVNTIIISIFHRGHGPGEVKELAQGHTASNIYYIYI